MEEKEAAGRVRGGGGPAREACRGAFPSLFIKQAYIS